MAFAFVGTFLFSMAGFLAVGAAWAGGAPVLSVGNKFVLQEAGADADHEVVRGLNIVDRERENSVVNFELVERQSKMQKYRILRPGKRRALEDAGELTFAEETPPIIFRDSVESYTVRIRGGSRMFSVVRVNAPVPGLVGINLPSQSRRGKSHWPEGVLARISDDPVTREARFGIFLQHQKGGRVDPERDLAYTVTLSSANEAAARLQIERGPAWVYPDMDNALIGLPSLLRRHSARIRGLPAGFRIADYYSATGFPISFSHEPSPAMDDDGFPEDSADSFASDNLQ